MTRDVVNRGTERNFGIDGLRMLAMFMVLILHILRQDGVLSAKESFFTQYETAWFLEIAAYCAVNCYALISGYVGIQSRYRYTNIAVLWLRVAFYTVLITSVFQLIMPETVGLREWVKAFFPVLSGQYWYFTAYFALFLFIPVLNAAAEKLTQRQYLMVVTGAAILLSVVPTLLRSDIFHLESGYSVWWLMLLYLIGGYIKLYGLFERCGKGVWLLCYAVMITGTWLSKWVLEILNHNGGIFVSYTSPSILLAAMALLQFFKMCHISERMAKWIKVLSPAAFSVYIIHANSFIWSFVIKKVLRSFTAYHPCGLLLYVLTSAFAIYIACSLVDMLREKLFQVIKLKETMVKWEDKHISPTNKKENHYVS